MARAVDSAERDQSEVESAPCAAKRGLAPKLQRQLERVSQLPKTQQRFVEQMLEPVIAQAGRS